MTVLKDGRTSAVNLPARETSTRELVSRMTGRTIEYLFPERRDFVPSGEPLLEVEGLTRHGEFADVSLKVHAGEIVGVAGLVGSGRSELLETVYGARRAHAGQVKVGGRVLRRGQVRAAVRQGIGMAPEERKSQALLLGEPVYRNVTLAAFPRFATAGFTNAAAERAEAARVTATLQLVPPDVRRPARTLSGGNQQKVVLGRWLLGATRVLLLDEPTRGVDVGARADLYGVIRSLAHDGVGVLLVSSEVPEVLGLADRVLVMREGRLVHEARAVDLDEHRVLDLVMAGSLLEGELPLTQDRSRGFRDALKIHGLKVSNRVAAQFTVQSGQDVTANLLQAAPRIDALWNHDDDQGVGVLAAIKQAGRDEFFMVGGAGSLDAMEHIKNGGTPLEATVTYPPTMASSAMSLARLVAQGKGMSDLVELQVPKEIVLASETITKANVDKYLPLGFRS